MVRTSVTVLAADEDGLAAADVKKESLIMSPASATNGHYKFWPESFTFLDPDQSLKQADKKIS